MEDLPVVLSVIGRESARLNWLDVVFKDLGDRALLLLLEHIEEEHQLVLALLAQLDLLVLFVALLLHFVLELSHLLMILFELALQATDLCLELVHELTIVAALFLLPARLAAANLLLRTLLLLTIFIWVLFLRIFT